MSLREEAEFGPPVTGPDHVATLVQLVRDGALSPEDIGDRDVREQVLKVLQEQV